MDTESETTEGNVGFAFIRVTPGKERDGIRPFTPLGDDHPVVGEVCAACMTAFLPGDVTCIVAIGPGDDEEAREKCKYGRPYNALGYIVHTECAGLFPES